MTDRILIAGIGNIFLGDDAFGVEVVRRLVHQPLPSGVRVADFGIRGFDLAYALMDGYETAILVDATPRGGAPGTIYTIEPDLQDANSSHPAQPNSEQSRPEKSPVDSIQDSSIQDAPIIDAHSLDPVTVLRLVKTLGGACKCVLVVGCEPESFGTEDGAEGRMGLSESVERAVGEAVDVIAHLTSKMLGTQENKQAANPATTLHLNSDCNLTWNSATTDKQGTAHENAKAGEHNENAG